MSKTVFQLIEEHGLKGLKVRHTYWEEGSYLEHVEGEWVDEDGYGFCMVNADVGTWEKYTEKTKMVTWYRPRIIQQTGSRIAMHTVFYKSKEDFYDIYDEYKVINDEWETIELPENIGEGL